ncbi:hypothetical protein COOONC_11962 [Cooperia oncophora]
MLEANPEIPNLKFISVSSSRSSSTTCNSLSSELVSVWSTTSLGLVVIEVVFNNMQLFIIGPRTSVVNNVIRFRKETLPVPLERKPLVISKDEDDDESYNSDENNDHANNNVAAFDAPSTSAPCSYGAVFEAVEAKIGLEKPKPAEDVDQPEPADVADQPKPNDVVDHTDTSSDDKELHVVEDDLDDETEST